MNDSLFLESERSLLDAVRVDALLDSLPVPVLVTNIDGTSTWPNASARQLDEWLKADDPKRRLETELVPALQMLAVSSEPTPLRLSLHQQRGDTRTYQATFATLPAGGARNELYAIMLAEIAATDTGDAQVRSEIAQARLEDVQRQLLQADRMASIGQLAAGVAHEINNPIGYIQSNLDTLKDYVAGLFRLIEAQEQVLRSLRASRPELLAPVDAVRGEIDFDFLASDLPTLLAESLEGIALVRKIILDLRDFSRAGHTEEWTLADIHPGIDSTINIVWNELKYKVELIKQYGELPLVECLPSQLNQVFLNILVNAGHAIEERGQIVIHTYAKGDRVYIAISDTGRGIPEEHVGRIFEPFFTTKPIGKGTGLGLSISYGIIQKHGGDIDVRSEVGVGTTFLISLPVRQPRPQPGAAA